MNLEEIAYAIGKVVIIYNTVYNRQRFYEEHDGEIQCLAKQEMSAVFASGQVCWKSLHNLKIEVNIVLNHIIEHGIQHKIMPFRKQWVAFFGIEWN